MPDNNNLWRSLVINFSTDKALNRILLETLRKQTDTLPADIPIDPVLEQQALDQLTYSGLNVVAAMHIGKSISTGKEIVSVCYPKPFMQLLPAPFIPEGMRDSLGFAVSSYFLKKVPFN